MAVTSKLTLAVITKPLKGTFPPILYTAFRNRQSCNVALQTLRQMVESSSFKPFFQRGAIDRLFHEEVTKIYGGGRYYNAPPPTLTHWHDLINNIAAPIQANIYYLRSGGAQTIEEKREAVQDIQANFRKLKIIEDWIVHHFDQVKDLIPPQALSPKS